MNKFLIGIISMAIFFIFNMFIMPFIGQFIFVGDAVKISYYMFIYTGLMTLCGVIIVCTCIVVEKLNSINDEIKKIKSTLMLED